MRALILLTGIASLCVMSNSAAQVVYKWIDADNVTHFSAQPPNGTDVERTTVKIRHTNRQALADRSKAAAAQNAAVTTRKQHEAEQAAQEGNLERVQVGRGVAHHRRHRSETGAGGDHPESAAQGAG